MKKYALMLFLTLAWHLPAAQVITYFTHFSDTNYDTNAFIVTPISSNIWANGSVTVIGNPVRYTPGTNGLSTNYFNLGWYALQNTVAHSGIVLNVWDSSQTVYSYTNFLQSGFNTYVVTVYGTNLPPTFNQITNALGTNTYDAYGAAQAATNGLPPYPTTNGFETVAGAQALTNTQYGFFTNIIVLTNNALGILMTNRDLNTSNGLYSLILSSTNGGASTGFVTNATNIVWASALTKFYLASNPSNYVTASVTNGLVSSNNAATTNGLASIALVQVYTNAVNSVVTTASNANYTTTILASNTLQAEIGSSTASPTNSWSLNGTTIGTSSSTLGTSNNVALEEIVNSSRVAYFGVSNNVYFGPTAYAPGTYSFAANYQTTASGYGATAFGNDTLASGQYSFAGGYGTIAGGSCSMAVGSAGSAPYPFDFVWSDGSVFTATTNNQFLIHSVNGVGINTVSPGTNTLAVAGNINASSITVNGVLVLTNAANAQTNISYTAVTNAPWLLTNGVTSIVYTNPATFLATNGNGSGLTFGLLTANTAILTPELVANNINVTNNVLVSGGASVVGTINAGALNVAGNAVIYSIAAQSETAAVFNASSVITVGGNTNFVATTNILRMLGTYSGTLTLASSSLYTNAQTTVYVTNAAAGNWVAYTNGTAGFISTTGILGPYTAISGGSLTVVYGNYENMDGVALVGEITNQLQHVFYGTFNSPVGNVVAFPPALYYKTGAGSLWEKTNSTFDANGWDCVMTNRPGT